MTAEIIAQDATARQADPKPEFDIASALTAGGRVVSWSDWRRIDDEERAEGAKKGKLREKMTSVREMLDFLA